MPTQPQNQNGAGQWKWIAGILAAIVLAILPGYLALYRTGSQVDRMEATQEVLLQRVSKLEAQNEVILDLLREIRAEITTLEGTP